MIDSARSASFCISLLLSAIVAFFGWRRLKQRHWHQHPPGPKGWPLIGNALDLDVARPWLTYEKWGKRYGGIVYSSVLGKDFIIVNDSKIAHELLDKQSSNYSDRPKFSSRTLFGLDRFTGSLQYGSEWRLHRRMYNVCFDKKGAEAYKEVQMEKVHQLLMRLFVTPQDYAEHLRTLTGAIIMEINYGYDVAPENDPFVTKITRLIDLIVAELTPERDTLYNVFPFLAKIPSSLPGGRYQRCAAECRALVREVLDDPFNYTKRNTFGGSERKSLVRDLLRQEAEKGGNYDGEQFIKTVAATGFLAGAETTFSTLLVFILAMVLHPEAQSKAQEEIDRIVGQDRLPDFSDREDLPYVEAIVIETLRWYPALPLGIPHQTTADDEFEGQYIPKGAIVMMNIWGMTHDETRFKNPNIFNPGRHLDINGKLVMDTSSPVFGLGRRICPGRHVAIQSVWAAVASMLAVLQIGKARDESGKEIDVVLEFTTGTAVHPKSFPCSIRARSPKAEQMIHSLNKF